MALHPNPVGWYGSTRQTVEGLRILLSARPDGLREELLVAVLRDVPVGMPACRMGLYYRTPEKSMNRVRTALRRIGAVQVIDEDDVTRWALRAAFESGTPNSHSTRWTIAEIHSAMRSWTRRHGRLPRASDWEKAGEGRPTRRVVQMRAGRFSKVVEESGAPKVLKEQQCTAKAA